jgi:protein TonB
MNGLGWKAWAGGLAASLAVHVALMAGLRPPGEGVSRSAAGPEISMSGQLEGVVGGVVGTAVAPSRTLEVKAHVAPPVAAAAPQAKRVAPLSAVPVVPDREVVRQSGGAVQRASVAPVKPVPAGRIEEVAPRPGDDARSAPAREVLRAPAIPQQAPARPVAPAEQVRPVRRPEAVRPREIEAKPERSQRTRRRARDDAAAQRSKAGNAARSGSERQGAGGAQRGGRARRASGGAVRSYGARVRARILANQPSAGGVGRAVVTFGVSASGGLRFVRLARSSGDGALDRAALAAVRRSQPFPAPPREASSAQLTFSISFNFR